MESYIDINKVIKFFEDDFNKKIAEELEGFKIQHPNITVTDKIIANTRSSVGDNLAEKIQNLKGKEKRIFLAIYEFNDNELLNKYDDRSVYLKYFHAYLADEFTVEEVKDILINLDNKGIIVFSKLGNENRIFPPYTDLGYFYTKPNDFSGGDWLDYTPESLTSNLTEKQKRIKLEIKRKSYFEYYGYYEEDKEQFFNNIKDRIRVELDLDKDVKFCAPLGFSKTFTGVSFTLRNSSIISRNPNAGTLDWVSEYKEGKLHGRVFSYYSNGNIQTEFIYNEGEKISERKFDKEGNQDESEDTEFPLSQRFKALAAEAEMSSNGGKNYRVLGTPQMPTPIEIERQRIENESNNYKGIQDLGCIWQIIILVILFLFIMYGDILFKLF